MLDTYISPLRLVEDSSIRLITSIRAPVPTYDEPFLDPSLPSPQQGDCWIGVEPWEWDGQRHKYPVLDTYEEFLDFLERSPRERTPFWKSTLVWDEGVDRNDVHLRSVTDPLIFSIDYLDNAAQPYPLRIFIHPSKEQDSWEMEFTRWNDQTNNSEALFAQILVLPPKSMVDLEKSTTPTPGERYARLVSDRFISSKVQKERYCLGITDGSSSLIFSFSGPRDGQGWGYARPGLGIVALAFMLHEVAKPDPERPIGWGGVGRLPPLVAGCGRQNPSTATLEGRESLDDLDFSELPHSGLDLLEKVVFWHDCRRWDVYNSSAAEIDLTNRSIRCKRINVLSSSSIPLPPPPVILPHTEYEELLFRQRILLSATAHRRKEDYFWNGRSKNQKKSGKDPTHFRILEAMTSGMDRFGQVYKVQLVEDEIDIPPSNNDDIHHRQRRREEDEGPQQQQERQEPVNFVLKIYDERFYPSVEHDSFWQPSFNLGGWQSAKWIAENEVWAYRKLYWLQGSAIPFVYGSFEVELPDGHRCLSLLMEYVDGPHVNELGFEDSEDAPSKSEAEKKELVRQGMIRISALALFRVAHSDLGHTRQWLFPSNDPSSFNNHVLVNGNGNEDARKQDDEGDKNNRRNHNVNHNRTESTKNKNNKTKNGSINRHVHTRSKASTSSLTSPSPPPSSSSSPSPSLSSSPDPNTLFKRNMVLLDFGEASELHPWEGSSIQPFGLITSDHCHFQNVVQGRLDYHFDIHSYWQKAENRAAI